MNNNSSIDLQLVIAFVLLTLPFVLLPPLNETPIRILLGLPIILFLPGYSLISALFPKKDDLDPIERIALSFGLSIAIVPLIGLILNYTPFGIRLLPTLISVSLVIMSLTLLAYIRRTNVDEDKRFSISLNYKLESPHGIDGILTLILLISVILSVCTLIYAITAPKTGERFTEFYILGPEGKAYNYPTNLSLRENGTVIIGIVNHEYEPTNYKLKIQLGNRTLLEKEITLNHNETLRENFTFTPLEEGNKKMEFLLYRKNNSTVYRSLHLWIHVDD